MTEITDFDLGKHPREQGESDSTSQDDKNWTLKAACQGVDTRVFFPLNQKEKLDYNQYFKRTARWRQYCPQCPVAKQCEAYAMETEAVGIFGGKLFVLRLNGSWKVYTAEDPPPTSGPKPLVRSFPYECTGASGEVHLIQSPDDWVGIKRCRACIALSSKKHRERKRERRRSEARVS